MSRWQRVLSLLLICVGLTTTVSIVGVTPATAAVDCSAQVMVLGLPGSGQKKVDNNPTNPANMGAEVKAAYKQFAYLMSQKGKTVTPRAILYNPSSLEPFSRNNIKKLRPSINDGIAKLMHEFIVDAKACPSRLYVFAGYSQGAMVIHELLTRQIPYRARIAVALFGSPYFHVKDPAAVGGDGKLSGINPWRLTAKTAKTYCLKGDPICNYSAGNLTACISNRFNSSCPHMKYKTSGVTNQAAKWLANEVFGYSVRIERVYVTDASGKAKTAFKCGQTVQYRVALVNITSVAKPVLLRFSVARVGSSIYASSGTVNTGPGTSIHFPKKTIPKGVSGKYAFVIASTDDYAGTTRATQFTVTCP